MALGGREGWQEQSAPVVGRLLARVFGLGRLDALDYNHEKR